MRSFARFVACIAVGMCALPPTPARAIPGRWMRVAEGSTSAPTARMAHAFAADPVRQRALVFGGYGYSFPAYDVWALSTERPWTWAPLYVPGTAPSGRLSMTLVRDPVRDHFLVFGGKSLSTRYADTWRLVSTGNLAEWNRVTTAGGPSAREAPAVWDSLRDRLLVFGGYTSSSGPTNELWALATDGVNGNWSALTTSGTPPVARYGHTLVLDTRRDRLLVFGGVSGGMVAQVWALPLSDPFPAWNLVSPAPPVGPSARYGHVAVVDAENDRMLVFGGYDGVSFLNDAWVLNLGDGPAWERVDVTGPQPAPRDFAAAVWDAANGRLLVFGGNTTGAAFSDTWALTLGDSPLDARPAPPSLAFAGASPNPARGDVWLSFTMPATGAARLRLYDAAGRLRGERAGMFAAGAHRVHMEAATPLAPGLYWATCSAAGERRTARIAVLR